MYEELTDAEYWKIADQKIARLRLSEEDMEKIRAWRSTSGRNILQLWEIYDNILTLRIRLEEPIKALREYTIPHPSYCDPDDRTMFAFRQPPPKLPDWQDYIVLAKERRDVSFFLHFLHYYEPVLNTRAAKFAECYDLTPYFADLKMRSPRNSGNRFWFTTFPSVRGTCVMPCTNSPARSGAVSPPKV